MKRTTITLDGYGRVAVPSDTANVWMSEMNGVGKAILCNRPDTPCRHTSRVQERSVKAL